MFNNISDTGWLRIARQLYAEDLKEEVLEFFEDHPNPSDDDLHDWAEEEGFDIEEVEEIVYSLLSESLDNDSEEDYDEDEEIEGGLADDEDPEKYDLDQLLKGIEVEFEHTDDPEIAMEIAMDHLEEKDDYYDSLSKMEEEE
jgi:hypothetical protein